MALIVNAEGAQMRGHFMAARNDMTIVKYVLMTLKNRTLRAAVGIQDNHKPIVYLMDRAILDDIIAGSDFSSPFAMYEGSLTEDEGREILAAAENNDFSKAIRLFKKYFRGENSDKVFKEDEAWRPISEEVPDEWFDECKHILSLLETKIRAVLSFERDEEDYR